MRQDQRERRRALVDLAALDPDPAVLDHVDAAPAVVADGRADRLDQLDEPDARRRRATPARRARTRRRSRSAPIGASLVLRVSVNGSSGAADHGFSRTPHSIARPHMFSSIEYSFSFDAEIGISHFVGELDAVGAGEAPDAHGRHHVEVGREDARRHLEAHLVVALAGAAVPDRVGAVPARRRDEVLDDDGPRERGDQRVLAFVERVGAQRGHEEVARELLARVDDLGLDRARGRGRARGSCPLRPARAGRRRPRTRSPRRPTPRASTGPRWRCRALPNTRARLASPRCVLP